MGERYYRAFSHNRYSELSRFIAVFSWLLLPNKFQFVAGFSTACPSPALDKLKSV